MPLVTDNMYPFDESVLKDTQPYFAPWSNRDLWGLGSGVYSMTPVVYSMTPVVYSDVQSFHQLSNSLKQQLYTYK